MRKGKCTNLLLILVIALIIICLWLEHFGINRLNLKHNNRDGIQRDKGATTDLKYEEMKRRREEYYERVRKAGLKERKHRLPDAIVIGTKKCGTGTLKNFLSVHPKIRMAPKEIHYYDRHLLQGPKYYSSILPEASEDELLMEKTPAYFDTAPANLPSIMKRDNQKVKIILLLCEPVARAFSDFVMRKVVRHVKIQTFEDYNKLYFQRAVHVIKDLTQQENQTKMNSAFKTLSYQEHLRVYTIGIYYVHLKRWLATFPQQQMLILDGNEFFRNPGNAIEEIQDFLSIPKILRKDDFVQHPETGLFCIRKWWERNSNLTQQLTSDEWEENSWHCASKGSGKTRSKNAAYHLKEETAVRFRKFYAPYNELLFRMIGKRFNW